MTYIEKLIRSDKIFFKFNKEIQKKIQQEINHHLRINGTISTFIHIENITYDYFGVKVVAELTIYPEMSAIGNIIFNKTTPTIKTNWQRGCTNNDL